MFQSDPMLNGGIAREPCQEITRQVQRYERARKITKTTGNVKVILPLRAVLVAIINLVIKSF